MNTAKNWMIIILCMVCSFLVMYCNGLRSDVENVEEIKDIYADRADHYADAAHTAQAERDDLQDLCDEQTLTIEQLQTAIDYNSQILDGMKISYAGSFLCTAYCLNCDKCQTGTITYSGAEATPGVTAAADLSVFPVGTWLYIDGVGIRQVQDTGGGVKSDQLDIVVDGGHDAAAGWSGYGYHAVYVLEVETNG